ncbi:MAG: transcriptional regulator NrdR [Ilumatobacteraceae bacterium]
MVDSRLAEDGGAVRRRRRCEACSYRFTTFERIDHVALAVVKSDGIRQPFDRAKVIAGVEAATKGRPVEASAVEALAEAVEISCSQRGVARREAAGAVTSSFVGRAVLDRLGALDEIAYLRFASVYKDFDAAADFHRELELLEKLSAGRSSE